MLTFRKKRERSAREEVFGRPPGDERPTQEEIAKIAYELYLKRGATDGQDLQDWLEAEKIIANWRSPEKQHV